MAWEIIDWLSTKDFCLLGMFNPAYDDRGQAVQAVFCSGGRRRRRVKGEWLHYCKLVTNPRRIVLH